MIFENDAVYGPVMHYFKCANWCYIQNKVIQHLKQSLVYYPEQWAFNICLGM